MSARRTHHPLRALAAIAVCSVVWIAPASAQTHIAVDASRSHQTMEGFGATTMSLAYADVNNVPAPLRTQAIDALYAQVRLNLGNVQVEPCEASATNVFDPQNDDANPATTNAAGFNWAQSVNAHDLVVAPGMPLGFTDFWLGPVIQTGFALRWAPAIRSTDRTRYLAELAEHVLAVVTHWRDAYGITPRFVQLYNEPTSGNRELVGGDATEMAETVAAVGARLAAGGFASMRIIVPAEETEEISLANAMTILSNASAAPYVGAIGYHPYPYGSRYASVPNILSSSGMGTPDAAEVAVRGNLRALGAAHGIPVFMLEVSHSELPFDDFRGVLGRAIHVHDELVYADAAAFFGMNAMWDTVSHAQHFMGRPDPGFWNETDTIVLIDVANARVVISPMGRAIGHYARFLRRGAVRVDATSDDARVLVTAFREPTLNRMVVVAINANSAARTLTVTLSGASLGTTYDGELSTSTMPWSPVSGAVAGGVLTFSMPASSVVTLSVPLAGAATDAGAAAVDAAQVDGGGTPMPDAAMVDGGGTPLVDAFVTDDSGTPMTDAASIDGGGTPTSDAAGPDGGGAPRMDAAAPQIDAGLASNPMNGGCGCHVVHGEMGVARAFLGCVALLVVTVRARKGARARRTR